LALAKADKDKKKKKDDKIKSKKSTLRKVKLEPTTSPTSGLYVTELTRECSIQSRHLKCTEPQLPYPYPHPDIDITL
jgi:hypothetical protein